MVIIQSSAVIVVPSSSSWSVQYDVFHIYVCKEMKSTRVKI